MAKSFKIIPAAMLFLFFSMLNAAKASHYNTKINFVIPEDSYIPYDAEKLINESKRNLRAVLMDNECDLKSFRVKTKSEVTKEETFFSDEKITITIKGKANCPRGIKISGQSELAPFFHWDNFYNFEVVDSDVFSKKYHFSGRKLK